MLRDFPIYLLFFFCIIAFTVTPCTADEGNNVPKNSADLELQYQRAKSFYDELHSTHLGKTRDNWLNGVRSFRKSYLSGPKSDFAAPSLYMLGRMYSNMYKRFKVDMDLNEALSYYRDVSSLFPESILADDALYAVGNLYLNKKNNPQRAAVFYSRIIADYSNGDMYPLASDKLKVLSKEQKISLPDAKHKHTSLDKLTYVLPVKYWSSADYTRVVIKTSGPVRFKERLLEKKGDKPRRLYLDFQGSYIDPKYSSPIPIKNGLLKQIRTDRKSVV